jgi:uncharacterized protein
MFMFRIISSSNMFKILPAILVVFAFLLSPLQLFAYQSPGKIINYTSDFANILSDSQEQSLNSKLKNFDTETSNEIAVVIIQSLGDETIETYANKIFEEYKLGKEKNDNGVLLLISISERKLRIEVGYGLEGALPDLLAKNIIDDEITPKFKQEKYYEGIDKGIDSIILATRNEYTPSTSEDSDSGFGLINIFQICLFGIFIFIGPLSYAMARSRNSYILGGFLGGVIGIIAAIMFALSGLWIIGIILIIPFVILGLIIDFILSMIGITGLTAMRMAFPNSSIGGSGGGWGGGGGGFSGGGGSSGGGGASGGW